MKANKVYLSRLKRGFKDEHKNLLCYVVLFISFNISGQESIIKGDSINTSNETSYELYNPNNEELFKDIYEYNIRSLEINLVVLISRYFESIKNDSIKLNPDFYGFYEWLNNKNKK